MTWTKIAFRNLWRNKRRSLLTLCAVALGYAAVNVFGGFTSYMFENLRDSFIHAQGNAHLQVFKKGYLQKGTIEPGKYFFTGEEFGALKEIAAADERIEIVAGRMHLTGFVNYDDISTVFVGNAMVPSQQLEIFQRAERILIEKKKFEGAGLDDADVNGVGVANGLAENLRLEVGSLLILMAPTLDGQMNAVDATVRVIFDNIDQSLNDKLIALPLPLGQSLYDTEGVGFACILLGERKDVPVVRESLEREMHARGIDVEIKSWNEISPLYEGTKNMFDIIFNLVYIILGVIVTMSVMNTIGMAVMERTAEVGTLRAMGLRRGGVVKVFSIESALLGVIGSTIGVLIMVGVYWMVETAKPTWVPPNVAREVRLQILLVPKYLITTFLLLSVLTMAAGVFPARRAARASIVDSLGHS